MRSQREVVGVKRCEGEGEQEDGQRVTAGSRGDDRRQQKRQ